MAALRLHTNSKENNVQNLPSPPKVQVLHKLLEKPAHYSYILHHFLDCSKPKKVSTGVTKFIPQWREKAQMKALHIIIYTTREFKHARASNHTAVFDKSTMRA